MKSLEQLYPAPPVTHSPEDLRSNLEEALELLRSDYVDIFYLHAPDRSTPFATTLQTINELYKEGKFRQFGLSNFTAFEVAEIALTCHAKGWVKPTIYQGMYNAISES